MICGETLSAVSLGKSASTRKRIFPEQTYFCSLYSGRSINPYLVSLLSRRDSASASSCTRPNATSTCSPREIEPLRSEMREIHLEMMASDRSYIAISKIIYPGVSLSISDLGYTVKEKLSYCRFKKIDGAIGRIPY